MNDRKISVFLADDNVIVREGVRALLSMAGDIEVVGVAGDYDDLVAGAAAANPHVVVTDIRMPPTFSNEGILAACEVKLMHPGTGVVVLSQYADPEYAIALLANGAAGYAYLLKERVADGDQLVRAVREVATGGSMLDPRIVEALIKPVTDPGGLSSEEEALLRMVAEGRTIKAIAAAHQTTAAAVSSEVDKLFLTLAAQASTGTQRALKRLKSLHQAIVDGKEQGESLSRLLPGGIAERVRQGGQRIGDTERLVVTVVMSDIRGYSTIAEGADPSVLAGQISQHRGAMNHAILADGGTIMQFVGDAVMAVYGAPFPQTDHADRAVAGAIKMHRAQGELNERWKAEHLPPFRLGIGVSTGEVAAALMGSEERLEYSVVGDSVNLAQRIQNWAGPGETVLSENTYAALEKPVEAESLPRRQVKGRVAAVGAFRIPAVRAAVV